MAKFWLINSVIIAGIRQFPGDEVDDTIDNMPAYSSAGAQLWPQGDPIVDAAAATAQNAHKFRGANEVELESIMRAATVANVLNAEPLVDRTALVAIDAAQRQEGDRVYVATYRQYFVLRKTSTAPLIDDEIIAATGGGRWERVLEPEPSWTDQAAWWVDPVAGNNENDGFTQLTAVKTLSEIARRLRVVNAKTYTINILATIPSTDIHRFSAQLGVGAVGPSATILLKGVLAATPALTGTFSAVVATNPATNQQNEVTDVAVTWSSFIGKNITMTSGAALGAVATVLKDLGAGVARVSEWVFPLTGVLAATPAPADAYKIDAIPSILCQLPFADHIKGVFPSFQDLIINPATSPGLGFVVAAPATLRFFGCEIRGSFASPTPRGNVLMFGTSCAFSVPTTQLSRFATMTMFAGASVNATWVTSGTGIYIFRNFVIQSGGIDNGVGTKQVFAGTHVFIGKVGIFDAPADAIRLRAAHIFCPLAAAIYGSGSVGYGTKVSEGAAIHIFAGDTPTLTGTGGELQVEGAATAIPELVAGAAVPAAASLTTWAEWNAAPFFRNVLNYKTGTKIVDSLTS